MANLGNFDATTVAPNSRPDPVPDGWYNVAVTQSEMKNTKDNTGFYLELGIRIMDGEYAGRMLHDRLNLQNANPVAVEIAYGTLSAICHATGVMQVQDSSQFHGIAMQARAVMVPAGPDKNNIQRDASNDIKGYRPASPAAPVATPLAQPSAPPQAQFTPPVTQQQAPAPVQTPVPTPTPPAPATAPAPPAPAGAAAGGVVPPWQR